MTTPPPRDDAPRQPPAEHVVLGDPDAVQRWCDYFGATREQIEEAVKAVGTERAAVQEHLLNQGASAGAG